VLGQREPVDLQVVLARALDDIWLPLRFFGSGQATRYEL
jgi:hypothetical protein